MCKSSLRPNFHFRKCPMEIFHTSLQNTPFKKLRIRNGQVLAVPKQQTLGTFDRVEFCDGALIDC